MSVHLVGGADEATALGAQGVDLLQDRVASLAEVVGACLRRWPYPRVRPGEQIQVEGVHPLQPPRERVEHSGSLAQASGGGRGGHLTCTGHGEFPESAKLAQTRFPSEPADHQVVGKLGGVVDEAVALHLETVALVERERGVAGPGPHSRLARRLVSGAACRQ